MRYRKKPVVIDAWRNDRESMEDGPVPGWLSRAMTEGSVWFSGGTNPYFTIKTLEGEMRADDGDWIIKGVKGELYPCKPDIFEMTYEAVA